MINNRKDITFFRGDTFIATLNFDGYQPSERDVLKYSLKKTNKLNEPVIVEHTIECPSEKYELRFEHEDTIGLNEGTYMYDVQLQVEGDVYKTILYGVAFIKGDVTE